MPDNSRAGLVWQVSDKSYFEEIAAPQRKRPPVRSPTGSMGGRLLYHRLGGGDFQAGRSVIDPVDRT